MPRYRYVGDGRAVNHEASVEVESGEEFDSPVVLDSPVYVLVDAPKKSAPAPDPAPAEEVQA